MAAAEDVGRRAIIPVERCVILVPLLALVFGLLANGGYSLRPELVQFLAPCWSKKLTRVPVMRPPPLLLPAAEAWCPIGLSVYGR